MTLIEIMVSMVVIGVLGTLIVSVANQMQTAGRITQCMSNLRQIHQALLLYFEDNQALPVLGDGCSLQAVLESRVGKTPGLFRCPEDRSAAGDSYSYFYVSRTTEAGADNYVLGCPRHRKSSRGVVIFGESHAEFQNLALVYHDGAKILPGDAYDYGTFAFADGSQVVISNGASSNSVASNGNAASSTGGSSSGNSGNAKGSSSSGKSSNGNSSSGSQGNSSAVSQTPDRPCISTLFSYRREDGTWYTVIRMDEGRHGTATFTVVPGNRFEVVTPAAVIAVRGTQFSVTTLKNNGRNATRTQVYDGTVDLEPVSHGHPIKLTNQTGKNKGYVEEGSEPVYE
jgi:hypothetical protein